MSPLARFSLPLLILPLLGLSACATVTGPKVAGKGSCSADELADYVGRSASARLGDELMGASGAKVLQWIQPGQMVTMDVRTDRLRVRLGPDNKVVSASCG